MPDWYQDSLDDIDENSATDDDDRFEWDYGNLDHIQIHDVTAEEAQEALLDPRRLGMAVHRLPDETWPHERRWGAIGATEDGRVLAIVFTRRGVKMRVVTVRNANPTERRRYQRR